jgi:hypothetical protein
MVWKEAEPPEFFHEGQNSLVRGAIKDARDASLFRTLDSMHLKKHDVVASKLGVNLVIPAEHMREITHIRDMSAELEEKHVVELRCFWLGRRINERLSVVDELIAPNPSKILITTDEFSGVVEKAVRDGDKNAIQFIKKKERQGLFRDVIKNSEAHGFEDILDMNPDLISSRRRVTITGELKEKLESAKPDRLMLDLHTHDKGSGESDIPTIDDYTAVRSVSRFDWFAICKTTNIDSLKSANILDDLLLFYVGKGSKSYLRKIDEIQEIPDERKRFTEKYELRFDMYHKLLADVRTYGQITG